MTVLFAQADGLFTPSPLLPAGVGPHEVRIDDFNADGINDLAVTNTGGFLALLPGLGDGDFGSPIGFGLAGTPLTLIKGDFDDDGTPTSSSSRRQARS